VADRILPAIRCCLPEKSKARIQAGLRQQELVSGVGSTLPTLGTELLPALGLSSSSALSMSSESISDGEGVGFFP
jgi:hypothetical protein